MEHNLMLRPLGEYGGLGPQYVPPDEGYQFLLLSLSAPASALAKFNAVMEGAPLPTAAVPPSTAGLYENFFNKRRTDPEQAYLAAKAFLEATSNSAATPEIEFARQWVAAYEKVKGIQ